MSNSNRPIGYQIGTGLAMLAKEILKLIKRICKASGEYITHKFEQHNGRPYSPKWRDGIVIFWGFISFIVFIIAWALFWKFLVS